MSNVDIELQRSMTNDQRLAFQSGYLSRRKDTSVAVLLAVFLGGVGAHHFYLGNIGLGIVYLLFFLVAGPLHNRADRSVLYGRPCGALE